MDDEAFDWAQAEKKRRARERGYWLFFIIFSLPVVIGIYLVVRSQRAIGREQAWAEAQLQQAQPDPRAYGVRGAGLLSQGQAAEALPLLEKAVALEAQGGTRTGVKALCMLIEARLELGDRAPGLRGPDGAAPGASGQAFVADAGALLKQPETRAAQLVQGPQAAAYHAAGKLYGHYGSKADAVRCLKKAVELQPDDWVTLASGERYKHRGVSSIYQKDLAAAELD